MMSRSGAFVMVTRPGGRANLTRVSPDLFGLTDATSKEGVCVTTADERVTSSAPNAKRRMRLSFRSEVPQGDDAGKPNTEDGTVGLRVGPEGDAPRTHAR